MARVQAAAGVAVSDLGSYQQAVRRVLTCDLITATRPRQGVLEQVLRWADDLAKDFRELLGYTLIATTRQVRLVRRLDQLDPTQDLVFARKGRPFDRRRLAYLCLVLASFQRSRVEISLADLVKLFTPAANSIEGLGFDPLFSGHKAAVVDVLDWLVDRGALRLSDGSSDSWVRDSEHGDALYDIDHDICAVLFRPARPVQHLTSVAGLLEGPLSTMGGGVHHEAAVRRARRLLVESPVVYFADLDPEVAEVLAHPAVAESLARFTGLTIERRAEGVLLADAAGTFTDKPFPGRGSAVNRTAGLLLAKIADLLEDREQAVSRIDPPRRLDEHGDLIDRIDSGLPVAGIVTELAWSPPERAAGLPGDRRGDPMPLVERSRLETMIDELYEAFGATSFTSAWQQDSRGLLNAAVGFLTELNLLRPVPGGVLVLPAAMRYRNIQVALPTSPEADGQLPLGPSAGSDEPDLPNESNEEAR